MFFNIHSHFPPGEKEWALQSFYEDFNREQLPAAFSCGIHPWYINRNYEEQLRSIKTLASMPAMLALGECGLDKVCDTDFSLQQTIFEKQVLLANLAHKPLIIHCVRAYEELLAILTETQNKMPVVFHGFNKSKELARQLTDHGFFLSFGNELQKETIQQYLPSLPLDQLCFETSDSNLSIVSIYELAAATLDIPVDDLSLQVKKNIERILAVKL